MFFHRVKPSDCQEDDLKRNSLFEAYASSNQKNSENKENLLEMCQELKYENYWLKKKNMHLEFQKKELENRLKLVDKECNNLRKCKDPFDENLKQMKDFQQMKKAHYKNYKNKIDQLEKCFTYLCFCYQEYTINNDHKLKTILDKTLGKGKKLFSQPKEEIFVVLEDYKKNITDFHENALLDLSKLDFIHSQRMRKTMKKICEVLIIVLKFIKSDMKSVRSQIGHLNFQILREFKKCVKKCFHQDPKNLTLETHQSLNQQQKTTPIHRRSSVPHPPLPNSTKNINKTTYPTPKKLLSTKEAQQQKKHNNFCSLSKQRSEKKKSIK